MGFADEKSHADGKSLADEKSHADGKSLADEKSHADGKSLADEKSLAEIEGTEMEVLSGRDGDGTAQSWLMSCNPELSALITELIGDGWKTNAMELEKLADYVDDGAVLLKLLAVKHKKKIELKKYLQQTQGIQIDSLSIYDVQVKRLHEYKRQQMNALYAIHKYFEIKAGICRRSRLRLFSVQKPHRPM